MPLITLFFEIGDYNLVFEPIIMYIFGKHSKVAQIRPKSANLKGGADICPPPVGVFVKKRAGRNRVKYTSILITNWVLLN